MGFGKVLGRAQTAFMTGGLSELGGSKSIGSFITGGGKARSNPDGTPMTPEQITTANLFSNLSQEQQKDLLLNNPNIVTPEGSQTYDPLTNTVRLNESDFTKSERLRQEGLASQLSGSLSGDFSNSGQAIQDATFNRGKAMIDPIVKQQRKNLAQQLADQGIPAGSEQFNEAMNRLDDSIARQYTDLSQASIQTGEQVRQSRFNEISSLLGRTQVGAGASFGQYSPQYQGIDLSGFAQQSQLQSNQLSFQNTQNQRALKGAKRNAMIGAIGGLGSSGIGAIAASDRSLKENITLTGKSPSGILVYDFEYKDKARGEGKYSGVMAQDLLKTHPEAILTEEDGTLKVDYSKIDVEFRRID